MTVSSLGLLIMAGCGSDPPTQPPPPPPPAAARVVFVTSLDTMLVGGQLTVTARIEDSNGNPVFGTPTFASSDPAVANFATPGVLRANRSGAVTITATFHQVSAQQSLWVRPILAIGPVLPSLFVGDTMQLAWDATGGAPAETALFTSLAPARATVTPDGLLTATGVGLAPIVASLGGTVESLTVAVLAPSTRGSRGIAALCGLERLCLFDSGVDTLTPPAERVSYIYAWSPDGARIALEFTLFGASRNGLWVANGDGTGAFEVERFGRYPAWSPDGSMTAYMSAQEVVMLAGPDWSAPVKLSSSPWPESFPRFTPDGRQVALIRENVVRLVRTAFPRTERSVPVPGVPGSFDLSPDGRWLAVYVIKFHSAPASGVEWHGVWLVRPDGTGLRPFSPNCTLPAHCTFAPAYFEPYWSPDGRYIVMRKSVDGQTVDEIEVRSVPDGALVMNRKGTFARWSPDGSRLGWIVSGQLHTSLPDGTDVQLIGTADGPPAWRPMP